MKYHDELVKIFGKAMEDNHIKNDTISLLEQGLSLEEITEYWKNPKNLKIINQANNYLISGREPLKPAIYPCDFEEQYEDDGKKLSYEELEAELAHDDDVDPSLKDPYKQAFEFKIRKDIFEEQDKLYQNFKKQIENEPNEGIRQTLFKQFLIEYKGVLPLTSEKSGQILYEKIKKSQQKLTLQKEIAKLNPLKDQEKYKKTLKTLWDFETEDTKIIHPKEELNTQYLSDYFFEAYKNQVPELKTSFRIDDYELAIPKRLTAICARPGHGKTTFMLSLLIDLAKKNTFTKRIYFCSFEDPREKIGCKIFNALIAEEFAKNNLIALENYFAQRETLSHDIQIKLIEGEEFLRKHQIYIQKVSNQVCVEDLLEDFYELNEKGQLDLIFIDYIQKLKTKEVLPLRTEQVKIICQKLEDFTTKTNVPVIFGSQLNRTVETKNDLRDTAISEAGSIEQSCDLILSFFKQPKDALSSVGKKEDILFCRVLKNRSGGFCQDEFLLLGNQNLIRNKEVTF